MRHARFTHNELGAIRGNAPRQISVPKRPGARRPELGTKIVAYARKVTDRRGEEIPRATVDCVIVAVEDQPAAWLVTFRRGVVEERILLRARPGAVKITINPRTGEVETDGDADYTTSTAAAAPGEPECIPEGIDRRARRVATVVAEPVVDRRPWKTAA